MLVLAFGPFAFVEIITLRFSRGWAVGSWGWRMFHISVPVTPQRHWDSGEELQWELWARVFTAFPHGDYCLTCISMLWCTTDSVFFLTAASNSVIQRTLHSLNHKLSPWDTNCCQRIAVFSLFPLFWVILWSFIGSCSSRRSDSGTSSGDSVWGGSQQEYFPWNHRWELCEQPKLVWHHCTA